MAPQQWAADKTEKAERQSMQQLNNTTDLGDIAAYLKEFLREKKIAIAELV